MESLTAAVALGRGLLALERGRRSGVLRVRTELCACRIDVVEGVVRAIGSVPGAELTLGDALIADGSLDVPAHAHAVAGFDASGTRIGDWLIERGVASRPAVEAALRRQLRARAMRLFACERVDVRFDRDAQNDLAAVAEPIATVDLVLAAMRARVRDWPEARARSLVKSEALQLDPRFYALRQAVLWPDEAVVMHLLARGTTLREVREAGAGSARAMRLLAVLALLSVLRVPAAYERTYALLLRKRGQLRHGDGARALLDLPSDADAAEARRALRRLARRVHPDALGPGASDALRRASSEVMSALIDAERAVRAADPSG
jgi:hypothetical protein